MKKIFFFLLLIYSVLAYSQAQKGDMSISVAASPLLEEGSNNFGLIGNVSFEFFVSSRVSLQSNFIISNNVLINQDDNREVNAYAFLPSIQYYFLNKEKINIFGQFGYGFGFDDESRNNGTIENSALRLYALGIGSNYAISDKLSVKLTIPYLNAKNKTLNENSVKGITVFIGFNFKL